MKAIDFFCGAGGLTRGLTDAGIDVLAGVDVDAGCRISYESNNGPARFIEADIKELASTPLQLLSKVPELEGDNADLLFAGCAPCQPFSQQRRVRDLGPRSTLLGSFGSLVQAYLPGQVLVENVPGIAKVAGRSTFRRFLSLLTACGYQYEVAVLNAKEFGVPQNRRRLVLLARRGSTVSLPAPTCGPGRRPFRTVRDAIGEFPPIPAGGHDESIPNHRASGLIPLNLERLRATPQDGGSRTCWPKPLTLACHSDGHDGHTDTYGRMSWDRPAPTLTGRCHSISNGRYGHPSQDRAISLREAAALQTFPTDYVFTGSMSHIALQIGNAVPVALGAALGSHLLELQESRANDSNE